MTPIESATRTRALQRTPKEVLQEGLTDHFGRPVSVHDLSRQPLTTSTHFIDRLLVTLDSLHTRDHVLKEMEIYSRLVSRAVISWCRTPTSTVNRVRSDFGPVPTKLYKSFWQNTIILWWIVAARGFSCPSTRWLVETNEVRLRLASFDSWPRFRERGSAS